MKIRVHNLLLTTTEDELCSLFATYGTVDRVQIVNPTATLSSALSLTPLFMGQIGTMITALHPDDQRQHLCYGICP